jgi:hypothetical protein
MASLLRSRLIEGLRIRNYSARTVKIYVRCVALFAKYFHRSPEELGEVRSASISVIWWKSRRCRGRFSIRRFARCGFSTGRR